MNPMKKPNRKSKKRTATKTKPVSFRSLVLKNRSIRAFYQDFPISQNTLTGLVDLARLTASTRNLQPLKYFLSCDPAQNALIFPHLRWAGYLKEGGIDIPEGERPSAYILVLCDKNISASAGCDHGIAAQTILLGAVEKGLGGCIIASINTVQLKASLKLPDNLELLFVIALGKPKEKIKIESLSPDGNVKYWRDEKHVHHVPKRKLDDIIVKSNE